MLDFEQNLRFPPLILVAGDRSPASPVGGRTGGGWGSFVLTQKLLLLSHFTADTGLVLGAGCRTLTLGTRAVNEPLRSFKVLREGPLIELDEIGKLVRKDHN